MTRKQLIAELKLIACGANGYSVSVPARMHGVFPPGSVAKRFLAAINETYLPELWFDDCLGSPVGNRDNWQTFETLADAIISEQKRLKAIKKQG